MKGLRVSLHLYQVANAVQELVALVFPLLHWTHRHLCVGAYGCFKAAFSRSA